MGKKTLADAVLDSARTPLAANNKRQQWTTREDNFLEKNRFDMKFSEIAKVLGRTESAVGRRIHTLGLQTRKFDFWSTEEEAILREVYENAGGPGAVAALAAAGFVRNEGTVTAKAFKLGLKRHWKFSELAELSQPDFYEKLSKRFEVAHGRRMKHKDLANLCYLSLSKINHYFSSGSSQEPMSIRMRHYLYVVIELEVISGYRRFKGKLK